MAASIQNSDRAVAASVFVVRAFVQLRSLLASHADLARRLDELEATTDQRFQEVFQTLRALLRPEPANRHRVGFRQSGGGA